MLEVSDVVFKTLTLILFVLAVAALVWYAETQ